MLTNGFMNQGIRGDDEDLEIGANLENSGLKDSNSIGRYAVLEYRYDVGLVTYDSWIP